MCVFKEEEKKNKKKYSHRWGARGMQEQMLVFISAREKKKKGAGEIIKKEIGKARGDYSTMTDK